MTKNYTTAKNEIIEQEKQLIGDKLDNVYFDYDGDYYTFLHLRHYYRTQFNRDIMPILGNDDEYMGYEVLAKGEQW